MLRSQKYNVTYHGFVHLIVSLKDMAKWHQRYVRNG